MKDEEVPIIGQLIRDVIDGKVPRKELDDLIKFLHSQEKWLDCKTCQGKGFHFKSNGTHETVHRCHCPLGNQYNGRYSL